MTLSRRTVLTSGGAALAASTFSLGTPAMALEGGSGIIIAILTAAVAQGEGAPKTTKIHLSDDEIEKLNSLKPRDQTQLLAELLNHKLSRAWDHKFNAVTGGQINKAMGGKGLREGEHEIQLVTKGPKWGTKITIVIKF